MIEKPKKILFEKKYLSYDVFDGPRTLFVSQRELAKLIVEKFKFYGYNNIDSLNTFLSQALKADDENGSKPLPKKLAVAINSLVMERQYEFNDENRVLSDFLISMRVWKKSKDDNNVDETLINLIQNAKNKCKVIMVLSRTQMAKFSDTNDTSKAIFDIITPSPHDADSHQLLDYSPNAGHIGFWWSKYQVLLVLNKDVDMDNVYKEAVKLNRAGRVKTFILDNKYCALPLYVFLESANMKYWSEESTIFSISFSRDDLVSYVKYTEVDAREIYDTLIKPILKNKIKSTEVKLND